MRTIILNHSSAKKTVVLASVKFKAVSNRTLPVLHPGWRKPYAGREYCDGTRCTTCAVQIQRYAVYPESKP